MSLTVTNLIRQAIERNTNGSFRLRPTNEFYKKIGIGRRRFGLIYRNEKPATIDELQKIAEFFNIPFNKLIQVIENNNNQ